MAGRGRSDAHHDAGGGSAIPVIGLDYGYLVKFEDVPAGESPSPILVTKCSVTKKVTADVLPSNGVVHPWCVQALVRVLLDAGHAKIILRSDDESAIVALKERAIAVAKEQHKIDVIPETTPHSDSQSNGLAEVAVRDVKGVALRCSPTWRSPTTVAYTHLSLPTLAPV